MGQRKKPLKKTFKKYQTLTVGGHKITVTRGKAHLSFGAGSVVEWEGKKARKSL